MKLQVVHLLSFFMHESAGFQTSNALLEAMLVEQELVAVGSRDNGESHKHDHALDDLFMQHEQSRTAYRPRAAERLLVRVLQDLRKKNGMVVFVVEPRLALKLQSRDSISL